MLPTYYPRAQFNGVLYWSCIYCAHINETTIRPATIGLACSSCERRIWYGLAMHVPANAATQIPKDSIIPEWADGEYPFDTIPQKLFEALPHTFFDIERRVKQRGRVHVIILHDNIYLAVVGADDDKDHEKI